MKAKELAHELLKNPETEVQILSNLVIITGENDVHGEIIAQGISKSNFINVRGKKFTKIQLDRFEIDYSE